MIATAPAIDPLVELVQSRLAQLPPSAYRFPLGYCTWGAEEILAALNCLLEQKTTMWTKTAAFEEQFAAYVGTKHAVMVNSGSSADLVLMLAARELGLLQPGDEILIPAVTWPTQVWAAVQAGFKVRLVDVNVSTLNTSADILEAAITSKTKAVFLVHLMGNPCDMDAINELCLSRGLQLFEDCCEALGASWGGSHVGRWGKAGTFSFFASHHISTMEGGMIVTDDAKLADACRMMRAHGWARDLKGRSLDVEVLSRYWSVEDPRYLFLGMGFNFRPTELNAAIGSIQLQKLNEMNAWRRKNAEQVTLRFRSTNGHCVEDLVTNYRGDAAWFALPFVLRENLPYTRRQVCEHLNAYGIDTRPIVAGNLVRHPAFWKYPEMVTTPLPGANAIHERGWYCGLPPIDCGMDAVIGALNSIDPVLRSECESR